MKFSQRWSKVGLALWAALYLAAARPAGAAGIPVSFTLDKPGYVTLVIEDKDGDRVCNLLSDTHFPAGKHTVHWDGYDLGARNEKGELVRHRVAPGTYRVRGLVHDRIQMRYELTVNSPGEPPWKTPEGDGAWLADQTPPADILFLPKGIETPNGKGPANFLVCSAAAETGDTFVWLDRRGRKLYGTNTGSWGGEILCRDVGERPVSGDDAYVLSSGELTPDNATIEIRAFRPGGKLETVYKMPLPPSVKPLVAQNGVYDAPTQTGIPAIAAGCGSNGMAAYNGLIVFSVTQMNRLFFVDARERKLLGETELPSPRGLLFDPQGRLIVVTGTQIKRFTIPSGEARLTDETMLIGIGLEDPRRVCLDSDGILYVADWGRKHQIEVYSPKLTRVRTIGKPGGPQLGHYDERRMSFPCGITTDDAGRLWVAEAEYGPKRISLWKQDGSFISGFYGPPQVGGGGGLDPLDRSIFYYANGDIGIQFDIDWKTGAYRPASIYWRPGQKDLEGMPGPAPERCFIVEGRRFLVNCYNGRLHSNQDCGVGIWRICGDGVARPVAMAGSAADLMRHRDRWGEWLKHESEITQLWKGEDPESVFFVWSDKSGDFLAQPEEVQFRVCKRTNGRGEPLKAFGLMPLVHADLSITTSYGALLGAPGLDGRDTPVYNLNHMRVIGDSAILRSPLVEDRWTLTYLDGKDGPEAIAGAEVSGKRTWRYDAAGAELDGKPAEPGRLVQPTRFLGPPFIPRGGHAGPIVAINGEMGAIYLMTMDGLFLQTLGGDARSAPPMRMRDLPRGAILDNVSFGKEHLHPTINQISNGDIILVAGSEHSSLFKLEGLNTVHRKEFGTLKVTATDLAESLGAAREPTAGR